MLCPDFVTLKWQPPYSPFLNIVENYFAQWKAATKRDLAEARVVILVSPHDQRMALLKQIAEQAAVIRLPEASGYFRHLQICLTACTMRQDILM